MAKLTHAQTIIEVNKLEKLKLRSGKNTTKDALIAAIDHYLNCNTTRFIEKKS